MEVPVHGEGKGEPVAAQPPVPLRKISELEDPPARSFEPLQDGVPALRPCHELLKTDKTSLSHIGIGVPVVELRGAGNCLEAFNGGVDERILACRQIVAGRNIAARLQIGGKVLRFVEVCEEFAPPDLFLAFAGMCTEFSENSS